MEFITLIAGGSRSIGRAGDNWLLSEEASYVTGNFIDLAGGK